MSSVAALDSGQITKIGVGVIIGLVVVGLLLSLIITAILGRIILAVVVLVLGIVVWQQRTTIEENVSKHKCDLNATFFGIHVQAPDDVRKACLSRSQ